MRNEELDAKNNFVIGLRDYLASVMGTENYYTYGNSEYEASIEEYVNYIGYSSVRLDPSKPKDITGFCFRKDLCNRYVLPGISGIMDHIQIYAKSCKVETRREPANGRELMEVSFGNVDYIVTVNIGEGYADEINVHFLANPFTSIRRNMRKIIHKK